MLRRWSAPAALLAAGVAVSLVPLAPASGASSAAGAEQARTPSVVHVVALGDSYMAGIGAGDYWERDGCRRSTNSYAALWTGQFGGDLTDLSCPGAQVADVAKRLPLVPADADVLLVQVGGNDVGFGSIAGACVIGGTSSCVAAADRARAQARSLPARLTPLLRAAQAEAPGARTLALGYPTLVGAPPACAASTVGAVVSPESVDALRRLQRSLDSAIRLAASAARVGYLDWPVVVNRHSLCSDDPWYVVPGTGRLDDLLHPTVDATEAMAAHLRARGSR